MSKKILVGRHQHKLKTENNSKWKTHPRYKENRLDTPLSKKGMINAKREGIEVVRMHKKGIINLFDTKYIYTSPLQRCVTTALEIIKVIEKELKYKMLIRLEYQLSEGQVSCKIIRFEGLKAISVVPKYEVINGKKYYTEIDKKLKITNLFKLYDPYIDKGYKTTTNHKIESGPENATRIIKCVNKIINQEKKFIIMIGHASILYHTYNYFLQLKNVDGTRSMFNGDQERTGTLVGYEKKGDKYKIIYKPNNSYNLSGTK